jgi:hypothetical protein
MAAIFKEFNEENNDFEESPDCKSALVIFLFIAERQENNEVGKADTTRGSDLNENSLQHHLTSSQHKISQLSLVFKIVGFTFLFLGIFGIVIQ